jgi:hypothetical protein
VQALLERTGRFSDVERAADEALDQLSAEQPVLASCYQAAAAGRELLGPRAGQPTLRLVEHGQSAARTGPPGLCGEVRGVNVHAGTAIDGRDRKRLERLCRYIARPAISQERLTLLPDGRLHYAMKKTFRDGTCELSFEPLSFIGRLLALIPPPRFHMLRYAGVLGPGAKLRHQVVPAKPAQSQRAPVQLMLVQAGQPVSQVQDDASTATRHPWSMLLKHVFAVDVTACLTCGGPMRLLSIATTPKAIGRALYRAGLGPQPPPPIVRQRAADPQLSLAFA